MLKTLGAISNFIPAVILARTGALPRGCTGILAPGMEARILREDGTEAGVNEPGMLWLRGRNVALGYLYNEKATQETFIDGWLRTGDRFRVDEKGFFLYVGFSLSRVAGRFFTIFGFQLRG